MQVLLDGAPEAGMALSHAGPVRGGRRRRAGLAAMAGAGVLAMSALSVLGAGGTAFAAQRSTHTAKASHTAKTNRGKTKDQVAIDVVSVSKYGKILVDQRGLPLYYDTSVKPPSHWPCKGACLTVWPPLVLAKGQAKPVAGKGVTRLAVVKGPSGEQVTWDGKPLYTFVRDTKDVVRGQDIVQDGTWKVAQVSAAQTTGKKIATTKPKSSWA